MTDFDSDNAPEYTVSELSFALKRTVEDSYGRVRVRGEVFELARPRSGHVYFKLKDDKAALDAICWKGVYSRLRFPPEDGLEVIAVGKVTTYPPRSTYQIIIETIEPAGEGALLARLEKLRKRLAAEGLFDEDRKQPLPYLPEVIGVVTSPTGAVFRDILHRLRERFPRHVVLWPVPVQGEDAAEKIAAAIAGFNALAQGGPVPRPDVLIVGRGGGSLDDLWSFNDEIVVRAAAASRIPLISAVGHETDTTLIDFAADVRAPTPTAAAEFAVPVREHLIAQVAERQRRLAVALSRLMNESRAGLHAAARGLRDPRDLLNIAEQRYDDAGARLGRALRHGLDRKAIAFRETAGGKRLGRALLGHVARHQAVFAGAAGRLRPGLVTARLRDQRRRLETVHRGLAPSLGRRLETLDRRLDASARLLGSLGYQNVLARGFALVRDSAGQPVKAAARTRPGMAVMVEFRDGSVGARIDGSPAPAGAAGSKAGAARGGRKPKPGQGDLF